MRRLGFPMGSNSIRQPAASWAPTLSPTDFFAGEIGEFFRKWRARQDSNLRPPA